MLVSGCSLSGGEGGWGGGGCVGWRWGERVKQRTFLLNRGGASVAGRDWRSGDVVFTAVRGSKGALEMYGAYMGQPTIIIDRGVCVCVCVCLLRAF